jgi:hypothetical protein
VVGLEGRRRLDVAPLTGLVLWAIALPMSRVLRAVVIISFFIKRVSTLLVDECKLPRGLNIARTPSGVPWLPVSAGNRVIPAGLQTIP